MKKTAVRVLSVILIILTFTMPFCASASQPGVSTLTLTYTKDNVIFSGLEIRLHYIASTDADGSYKALLPYDAYHVKLNSITSQTEWSETASTLAGYISADGIQPYKAETTSEEGIVSFSALEEGLYLVEGVSTQANGLIYTFYDFMISLPGEQGDDSAHKITAIPKAVISEPDDEKTKYTVTKLWKDAGSYLRPASVKVDILKDGKLYETVTLDDSNNWRYSFETTDTQGVWSVAERDVSENYTVKVTRRESSFVIINTIDPTQGNDPKPPQTGDTAPMRLYIILMCASGLLLVILGIAARRKDDAHHR